MNNLPPQWWRQRRRGHAAWTIPQQQGLCHPSVHVLQSTWCAGPVWNILIDRTVCDWTASVRLTHSCRAVHMCVLFVWYSVAWGCAMLSQTLMTCHVCALTVRPFQLYYLFNGFLEWDNAVCRLAYIIFPVTGKTFQEKLIYTQCTQYNNNEKVSPHIIWREWHHRK